MRIRIVMVLETDPDSCQTRSRFILSPPCLRYTYKMLPYDFIYASYTPCILLSKGFPSPTLPIFCFSHMMATTLSTTLSFSIFIYFWIYRPIYQQQQNTGKGLQSVLDSFHHAWSLHCV